MLNLVSLFYLINGEVGSLPSHSWKGIVSTVYTLKYTCYRDLGAFCPSHEFFLYYSFTFDGVYFNNGFSTDVPDLLSRIITVFIFR